MLAGIRRYGKHVRYIISGFFKPEQGPQLPPAGFIDTIILSSPITMLAIFDSTIVAQPVLGSPFVIAPTFNSKITLEVPLASPIVTELILKSKLH